MIVEFEGGDRLVFYSGTNAALFTEVELQGESSWRGQKKQARPRVRQAKAIIDARDERGYSGKLLLDQTDNLAISVEWQRGQQYIHQHGNEYDTARDAVKSLAKLRVKQALQENPHVAKLAQIEHIEHRIKGRDRDITFHRDKIEAAQKANAADYTTLGQLQSLVNA